MDGRTFFEAYDDLYFRWLQDGLDPEEFSRHGSVLLSRHREEMYKTRILGDALDEKSEEVENLYDISGQVESVKRRLADVRRKLRGLELRSGDIDRAIHDVERIVERVSAGGDVRNSVDDLAALPLGSIVRVAGRAAQKTGDPASQAPWRVAGTSVPYDSEEIHERGEVIVLDSGRAGRPQQNCDCCTG